MHKMISINTGDLTVCMKYLTLLRLRPILPGRCFTNAYEIPYCMRTSTFNRCIRWRPMHEKWESTYLFPQWHCLWTYNWSSSQAVMAHTVTHTQKACMRNACIPIVPCHSTSVCKQTCRCGQSIHTTFSGFRLVVGSEGANPLFVSRVIIS